MRIRLYNHPFADQPPEVFEADSLTGWLISHYGETPNVKIQIFTGEPCAENEISGDFDAILNGDAPEYVILQSPGWEQIIIRVVIMVAMMVIAQALAPKPVLPSNVNRTQQSPNNALASRQNTVRIMERVEDIFGTVKSVPSLLMPTYNKYLGHRKYEYGYYCVGRGYYDLAEIRDGDTLMSEITGAAAAVYEPFTSPNSGTPVVQIGDPIIDRIITAERSIEIDGLTLQALNQVQLIAEDQYEYKIGGVINQKTARPNFNSVCSPGDEITVVMDDFLVELTPEIPPDPLVPEDTGTPATYATYNYSGSYEISSVGDKTITVAGASWPVDIPWELSVDDGIPVPPDGGGA